jgi:hypothetical protein
LGSWLNLGQRWLKARNQAILRQYCSATLEVLIMVLSVTALGAQTRLKALMFVGSSQL